MTTGMQRGGNVRRICLGAVIGLAVAAGVGCGSAASSSTSVGGTGPTTPSALAKPGDPARAVADAAARTAGFHDVKFDIAGTLINASGTSTYTGSSAATKAPARIDSKNSPIFGGKAFEDIQDLDAHTLCSIPQGGPLQKFPNQTASAATVDPFHDIVTNGSAWAYEQDVVAADGSALWQVQGMYNQSTPGGQITYQLSTITVSIDSRSGRIVKTMEHAKLTDSQGAKTERTTTDENFVYDTGLSIAAC